MWELKEQKKPGNGEKGADMKSSILIDQWKERKGLVKAETNWKMKTVKKGETRSPLSRLFNDYSSFLS